MLRRLLPALVLGAVLLVPSSSLGAAAVSNLSGTIEEIEAKTYRVKIRNNGPDRANYIWIRMPTRVEHTGASADQGGGCAPGGDANTVRCYWGSFLAGETRNATITTNVTCPTGGGAQLSTGDSISGPRVAAGTATGPPGPARAPCKCTSLTSRLLPGSLSIRDVEDRAGQEMHLSFSLHWTLGCSKGTGRCGAELTLVAPKGATYRTSFYPSGTSIRPVSCRGDCAEVSEGTSRARLIGPNIEAHDRRAIGRMPLVIKRECEGRAKQPPPIRLYIAFNSNGNIDVENSKLR